jgi:hypothetical protein
MPAAVRRGNLEAEPKVQKRFMAHLETTVGCRAPLIIGRGRHAAVKA